MTTRRRWMFAIVAAVIVSAVATVLLSGRLSPVPDVPVVPAEWTDPPMVESVTNKRNAVLANPRDGQAWGELGMAFDAHERAADAIRCYQIAMPLAPDDSRWPFLLAEQYHSRNPTGTDDMEALRFYRLALDRKSPTAAHRAAIELSIANMLAEQGSTAEARAIVERVAAADPANPWAAFSVGNAAAERGELDAAIRTLMPLARNPYAQKKAAATLAAIYRRADRAKEAEGFEYASSLLPPDRPWPNPFLEEVGRSMRGRKVYMESLTQLEMTRDYPRAVVAARRLADQYPGPETQLLMGRSLVNAEQFDVAIAVLEDAIRAEPNLVMAHASLGLAWLRQGERAETEKRTADAESCYKTAVAAFETATQLKPDYAPGYLYLAQSLAHLKRLPEAIRSARLCISARPEEWEAYLVLGELLRADGQKPASIEAVEQAVKLANPNEQRPRQVLKQYRGE